MPNADHHSDLRISSICRHATTFFNYSLGLNIASCKENNNKYIISRSLAISPSICLKKKRMLKSSAPALCSYRRCTKQKQSKCDGYCIAHYKLVNNLPPGRRGRKKSMLIPDVPLSCLPVISSSSNSSASSTQKNGSGGDDYTKTSNRKRASFTVDSADTSIVSKSTSAGKSHKLDRKGMCPKCLGDVRSPLLLQNQDGDHEPDNTIVTCAIKGCPAPKFHVSALC